MYKIKNKKLIFKNSVYKAYSNTIVSKKLTIKNYLSLEVSGTNYGGVCCLLNKNNSLGLMRVYSPITKKYIYSIPQGFVEKNENIRRAVIREVFEETGYKFNDKLYKKKYFIYPMHSLINSKLAVFEVNIKSEKSFELKNKVQTEIGVGKVKFYKKKKVKKLLKKPHNFDLITLAVILNALYL